MGQHRELLPELGLATTRHPLREGLWRQRMLALYRSGDRAQAVEAFRQARTVLAAELGIDPGSALRDTHQRILRADRLIRQPSRSPRT